MAAIAKALPERMKPAIHEAAATARANHPNG
jgi:hypothetical protein